MKVNQTIKLILDLAKSSGAHTRDYEIACEYLDNNEPYLALEHILIQMYEYDVATSEEQKKLILNLINEWKIDEAKKSEIRRLIS